MAWTQEQLFALESAIAMGVLEVQYPDGTRRKYRTLAEMQEIRRAMRADLGITSSTGGRKYGQTSKGLC